MRRLLKFFYLICIFKNGLTCFVFLFPPLAGLLRWQSVSRWSRSVCTDTKRFIRPFLLWRQQAGIIYVVLVIFKHYFVVYFWKSFWTCYALPSHFYIYFWLEVHGIFFSQTRDSELPPMLRSAEMSLNINHWIENPHILFLQNHLNLKEVRGCNRMS